MTDAKEMLHGYLRSSREAIMWKLEDLPERDLRWPHTPTGTNLLGLVKHLAGIEFGYFGDSFDRPGPVRLPWLENDDDDNADMWATADESVEYITGLYRQSWEHADTTITALDLDSPGHVPWWGEGDVTLHRILVHVIAETARHAGHADIVREQIDGSAGLRRGLANLSDHDAQWWEDYVAELRAVADTAGR